LAAIQRTFENLIRAFKAVGNREADGAPFASVGAKFLLLVEKVILSIALQRAAAAAGTSPNQ